MIILVILILLYLILYFIINFNKNKPNNKNEIIKKTKKYNYNINNSNQKLLKSIYNSEDSIADAYLETYKDGTAIKVILLKNDEIVGDIYSNDVEDVKNLGIKTTKIYVEHKLNNNGEMEYFGEIYGEITRR